MNPSRRHDEITYLHIFVCRRDAERSAILARWHRALSHRDLADLDEARSVLDGRVLRPVEPPEVPRELRRVLPRLAVRVPAHDLLRAGPPVSARTYGVTP